MKILPKRLEGKIDPVIGREKKLKSHQSFGKKKQIELGVDW